MGTVGIDVFSANHVELIGLEMIGSRYAHGLAVDFGHRGFQPHYTGVVGEDFSAVVQSAERNPAHPIVVDHHAGIEIG